MTTTTPRPTAEIRADIEWLEPMIGTGNLTNAEEARGFLAALRAELTAAEARLAAHVQVGMRVRHVGHGGAWTVLAVDVTAGTVTAEHEQYLTDGAPMVLTAPASEFSSRA